MGNSLIRLLIGHVAAYLVQNVVAKYEYHHKALKTLQSPDTDVCVDTQPQVQNQESKGKECSNLMVLLSELYNFQVISSVLVFDLVRQLLDDDLNEFDVELLLKLMRSAYIVTFMGLLLIHTSDSGQQLRQDDPTALKDIIDIVQKRVGARDEKTLRYVKLKHQSFLTECHHL